jgi:hypothetical protein
LELDPHGLSHGFNVRKILRLSLHGAVEINQMNYARSGFFPPSGH